MATLEKIKLNQFRKAELEKRQMNALKGGGCRCKCACVGTDYGDNFSCKEEYQEYAY